jgi:hypothetical protein
LGSVNFRERAVRVGPELAPAQACKTLIHELGHIHAGHDTRHEVPRAQRETEAESIAYIVGQHYGLDSIDYSAPYVTGWSGGNPEVIRAAAEHVHRAAAAILADLDTHTAAATDTTATTAVRTRPHI